MKCRKANLAIEPDHAVYCVITVVGAHGFTGEAETGAAHGGGHGGHTTCGAYVPYGGCG
ncbi:MAG: hypothetical protein ACOY3P_04715 [Planctomycetota bacterium]